MARGIVPPDPSSQVVWWLVTSSGECDGDRATAVRLGQDLVSHRLLTPVCAGYDRPKDPAGSATGGGGGGAEEEEPADLFGSFDDAAGWLFAFEGDALRNPFAPPPPIQVSVMTNTGVEVAVTGWIEVRHEFCGACIATALFDELRGALSWLGTCLMCRRTDSRRKAGVSSKWGCARLSASSLD